MCPPNSDPPGPSFGPARSLAPRWPPATLPTHRHSHVAMPLSSLLGPRDVPSAAAEPMQVDAASAGGPGPRCMTVEALHAVRTTTESAHATTTETRTLHAVRTTTMAATMTDAATAAAADVAASGAASTPSPTRLAASVDHADPLLRSWRSASHSLPTLRPVAPAVAGADEAVAARTPTPTSAATAARQRRVGGPVRSAGTASSSDEGGRDDTDAAGTDADDDEDDHDDHDDDGGANNADVASGSPTTRRRSRALLPSAATASAPALGRNGGNVAPWRGRERRAAPPTGPLLRDANLPMLIMRYAPRAGIHDASRLSRTQMGPVPVYGRQRALHRVHGVPIPVGRAAGRGHSRGGAEPGCAVPRPAGPCAAAADAHGAAQRS